MNIVYIHGSYFGNNFGDVLLVDLFAKRVKDCGFEPRFPFASEFYFKQTGVPIGVVNSSNVVCGIYCGGGYMGEPNKGKLKWSIRNFFRHRRSFNLYNDGKIKYGVFGAGFGPITYNPYKKLALSIIKNSRKVFVRDEKSKEYICQYLPNIHSAIRVNSDVVISLKKSDIPKLNFETAQQKFCSLPKFDKYIGIHLTNKFKDPKSFKYIADAIEQLSKIDSRLCFVFISDGKSRSGRKLQQEVDAEYIRSKISPERCCIYNYQNHWELTAYLSLLDVVVTSKLHVGIVSTAMKTSVISIPYHSKTIRYYSQVKAEDRCLTKFDSSEDVLEHLVKNIDLQPINVPLEVINSSSNVFVEMNEFIKSCEIH